jgi:hypothetical protein
LVPTAIAARSSEVRVAVAAGDDLREAAGVVLAGTGEEVLRPLVVVAVALEESLEVGLAVAAVDEALVRAEDAVADGGGAGAALDAAVLEDRERVLPDDDLGAVRSTWVGVAERVDRVASRRSSVAMPVSTWARSARRPSNRSVCSAVRAASPASVSMARSSPAMASWRARSSVRVTGCPFGTGSGG